MASVTLTPGVWHAGIDKPFFATDSMIVAALTELGFRDVQVFQRVSTPPPVDPASGLVVSTSWDIWGRGTYDGPPKPVELNPAIAWLVPPQTAKPSQKPLQLRPGRNVWLLARTDRDGPTEAQVYATAASYLCEIFFALGDIGCIASEPALGAPPGVQRRFVSKARPADFLATLARPTLPLSPLPDSNWHVNEQPGTYGVLAQTPWYVLIDFDWRGKEHTLPKWPTKTIGTFGWANSDPSTEADWLLLQAAHYGDASRPDTDWTGNAVQTAKDKITETATDIGSGLAIAALLYFLLSQSGGRRRGLFG